MGKIKDKALGRENEKQHELTEAEFNYLVTMNNAAQYRAAEDRRVITAFLYYVAVSRLGYKSGQDLKFEIDLEDKAYGIKITPLPDEEDSSL